MLLWPTVAAVGFFAMAGLVVLLGTSSTARYEFERNRVQGQRQQAAAPAAVAAVTAEQPAAEQLAPAATGTADPAEAGAEQTAPSNVAVLSPAHPAGRRRAETVGTPAWWLVEECDGSPGTQVLAGPFADQVEADWAALAGLETPTVVVHGVLRADGAGVVRRQTPEEKAWLADLGDQLDRLPAEWDDRLDEDDELATLVVEIAGALVEAGLPLHDCVGDGPAGGICLTPAPDGGGVLVSWQQHDRMSRLQVRGPEAVTAVQHTMNAAIAGCLSELGFDVEPLGPTGCPFVPAAQEWC